MTSLQNKRRPWPWDLNVNGLGLMLTPTGEQILTGKRADTLDVTPTVYEYGSSNPFLERTYPFMRLTLGMGQRVQEEGLPKRYFYALNADLSINGRWQKAPKFNLQTVSTGIVTGIIRGIYNGTELIYVTSGRYLRMRNSDGATDFTDIYDAGSGNTITSLARFKDARASGTPLDCVYLGTSNGKLIQIRPDKVYTDSAIVVDLTSSSRASGTSSPVVVETLDKRMHYGWANFVSYFESDPTVANNHGPAFRIGDASQRVTWLKALHGSIFVFKTNGVYTLDLKGESFELFPGLRPSPSVDNGVNAAAWLDSIFLPYRDGFYRLNADGSLKPIGTEQLLDNGSEVQGRIVAFAGHNTWFGYCGMYNPSNTSSYVTKFGGWIEDSETINENSRSILSMKEVYHGALKKFINRQVTLTQVISIPGANDRLYVGFADGGIAWCFLPTSGPNPANDSTCDYCDEDGEVNLPQHHANFQADIKEYHGFAVFGAHMSPTSWAEVYYTTDQVLADGGKFAPLLSSHDDTVLQEGTNGVLNGTNVMTSTTGAFTSADVGRVLVINTYTRTVRSVESGTSLTFGGQPLPSGTSKKWQILASKVARFTQSGARVDFDPTLQIMGKDIWIKVLLCGTGGDSPMLDGIAVYARIHPAFFLEYLFTVQAYNRVTRRDGAISRHPSQTVRDRLKDIVAAPGTASVWLPHGVREDLSVIDYAEHLKPDDKSHGREWDVALRALQFRTYAAGGTLAGTTGFSYATLKQYTYNQLSEQQL